MILARNLLLSVLALTAAIGLGFLGSQDPSVDAGNAELRAASVVESELESRFGLVLNQAPANPSEFSWIRFSLAERQAIKEKAFAYLAHMNRVMEIDSQKGIYITGREALLAKMDFAATVIKSAQIFEQRFGENFDGKKPVPPFKQAVSE